MESLRAKIERRLATRIRTKTIVMRNPRPMVSFTFDDCPKSAIDNGALILKDRRLAGTFYLCGGLCGRLWQDEMQFDREDITRLVRDGHEIGCHTYNHRSSYDLGVAALKDEIKRNQSFVREIAGDYLLSTFAYPWGQASVRHKLQLQRRFGACRGTREGVNARVADLGLLDAVALPRTSDASATVQSYIDEACAKNGWLIFYTHDVRETPSEWGCTPSALNRLIDAVVSAKMEIWPVKNALGRAMFGDG